MNKKAVIAIVGVIIVVSALCLILGTVAQYHDNSGEVTAKEGNVSFKYNNDKSSTYYYEYYNGSTAPLYNEYKLLNGTVKIDLNDIKWDENYEPTESDNHPNKGVDAEYAQENVVTDISNDLNGSSINELKSNDNINFTYEITYYDENNSVVTVQDYSKDGKSADDIIENISLDGSVLTLNLFKDYQKNYTENISNAADYSGALPTTQSDVDTIDHAVLTLTFEGTEQQYIIDVDLKDDAFNATHS